MLTVCTAALAVPAKPGLKTVRQPDGTELRVRLVGDEHSHYYVSEDGYPLVKRNGAYYYGMADADGNVVGSQFMAQAVASRSDAAQKFLSGIDKETVLKAAGIRAASLRKARLAKLSAAKTARKAAPGAPQRTKIGLFDDSFPVTGEQKAIVILVEYQDVKFKLDDPYNYFSRMINEDGFSDYGGTGCAAEYFRESSNGQFRPEFDVYGPITLANNMRYYGGNDYSGNDRRPYEMVIEACQQLDPTVDFSQYDRNGDGFIDNVFVFYAGEGEATSYDEDTVWPHSWNISYGTAIPYFFDGVRLDRYACSNEWVDNRPDGVGTFVHEFSHVMGLPDLYDTDYSTPSPFTPGRWSVLDAGPYNNDGCTPPLYSIYERYSLGWIEPTVLGEPADISLESIGSNVGCIIPTDDVNEFYLLENRQQTGWDAYIPGHGMLVWHVDFDERTWQQNTVNNNASHQCVDLVEADNTRSELSRAGDAFPGTGRKNSFSSITTPALQTWSGTKIDCPITDITESNGKISFKVSGGGANSGISSAIAADGGVRLSGCNIIVDAKAGERIVVADALGRILRTTVSDGHTLSLPFTGHGICVVKVGDRTYKLAR